MTARRAALIPAVAWTLAAASFAVAFRRTGRALPDLIAWLDEHYPETETP